MTYTAIQDSVQRADPIYLFKIVVGGETLRYTSAAHDVVANGETWLKAPIKADKINLSDKMAQEEFALSLPFDHELPQKLMGYIVTTTSLTVFSYYLSDADDEVFTEFVGADATVSPEDRKNCKIVFSSIFRVSQKEGLAPRFSKRCRHAIYSTGCGLDKDDHKQTATIDTINGKTITINETLSAGNFTGGMLKTPQGTYHYIYLRASKVLTMFDAVPFLAVGDTIELFEGCDQTIKRCRTLNNAPNFGGDVWLGNNPFDGRFVR